MLVVGCCAQLSEAVLLVEMLLLFGEGKKDVDADDMPIEVWAVSHVTKDELIVEEQDITVVDKSDTLEEVDLITDVLMTFEDAEVRVSEGLLSESFALIRPGGLRLVIGELRPLFPDIVSSEELATIAVDVVT